MDQTRILIVDDEPSIVKMLQMVLRKEGFNRIYTASSCKEALSEIAAHGADIVLLDVMLPDGTGFDLCPQIRSYGSPHILFLTAKASDLDVLTGFAMGGDDYVTKPFNPLEIAARIKARLRRGGFGPAAAAEQPAIQRAWDFGRFKVDESAGELTVLGEPVPCPAQVFQLLLYFASIPGSYSPSRSCTKRCGASTAWARTTPSWCISAASASASRRTRATRSIC